MTPANRRTSSRSPGSVAATPVCTGLTTPTRDPRAAASAVTAAVTTVFPTPVPVPVTTRTLTAPDLMGPGFPARLTPAADGSTLWPSANAVHRGGGRHSRLDLREDRHDQGRVAGCQAHGRDRGPVVGVGAVELRLDASRRRRRCRQGELPRLHLHPPRRQGVAGPDDGVRHG